MRASRAPRPFCKPLRDELMMMAENKEAQKLAKAEFCEAVHWNKEGLAPAVVQCRETRRVLMLAWMNRDALIRSLAEGRTVFWSRSRNQLWRKGETSGAIQRLFEVRLDCDGDTLLLLVEQLGSGSCHTGRPVCFFRVYDEPIKPWARPL